MFFADISCVLMALPPCILSFQRLRATARVLQSTSCIFSFDRLLCLLCDEDGLPAYMYLTLFPLSWLLAVPL